jgi:predicted kinase
MQAVVFSGIPASGKTSFYREHFFNTHVRISLDLLKTRPRENILLHACLAAKQPFVVDNTNLTAAHRAHYAKIAHAAGFKAILYFFDIDAKTAMARNDARRPKVPPVAIYAGRKKLQPPTVDEPFEEIHIVRFIDGKNVVERLTK